MAYIQLISWLYLWYLSKSSRSNIGSICFGKYTPIGLLYPSQHCFNKRNGWPIFSLVLTTFLIHFYACDEWHFSLFHYIVKFFYFLKTLWLIYLIYLISWIWNVLAELSPYGHRWYTECGWYFRHVHCYLMRDSTTLGMSIQEKGM